MKPAQGAVNRVVSATTGDITRRTVRRKPHAAPGPCSRARRTATMRGAQAFVSSRIFGLTCDRRYDFDLSRPLDETAAHAQPTVTFLVVPQEESHEDTAAPLTDQAVAAAKFELDAPRDARIPPAGQGPGLPRAEASPRDERRKNSVRFARRLRGSARATTVALQEAAEGYGTPDTGDDWPPGSPILTTILRRRPVHYGTRTCLVIGSITIRSAMAHPSAPLPRRRIRSHSLDAEGWYQYDAYGTNR